ncbi:MAG: hypothetical protein ACRYG7_43565 [Janthinobacterium lividum]
MNKPNRPSFATAAVAEITGPAAKPVNPDEALWPNAGTIKSLMPITIGHKEDKDEKDVKPEKITFSNKLEAATYLKLQQLATYGGENIQEILEAALTAYFAEREEASRPLPPKALATLRRKYPFL